MSTFSGYVLSLSFPSLLHFCSTLLGYQKKKPFQKVTEQHFLNMLEAISIAQDVYFDTSDN